MTSHGSTIRRWRSRPAWTSRARSVPGSRAVAPPWLLRVIARRATGRSRPHSNGHRYRTWICRSKFLPELWKRRQPRRWRRLRRPLATAQAPEGNWIRRHLAVARLRHSWRLRTHRRPAPLRRFSRTKSRAWSWTRSLTAYRSILWRIPLSTRAPIHEPMGHPSSYRTSCLTCEPRRPMKCAMCRWLP